MSKTITVPAISHVATHWGDNAPIWIVDLAKACDQTSQAAVALKLGRSASLVNQLLKAKYPGDLKGVEDRFNAAFDPEKHHCPILGQITGADCLKNQSKRYDPSNHISVRLFRACSNCPHALKGKNDVK